MSGAAVWAIARHEWASRWRSLLTLGVVVGIFGGLIVAVAGLTARTATAPDRLAQAVGPGDAVVQIFGDTEVASDVAALPMVERSWPAQLAVARVDSRSVVYMGVSAGPTRPPGMLEPVMVEGRAPDPASPDEVVVLERASAFLGVGSGDTVSISLLTGEEVAQFDTGFGAPDGPTITLTVVGVARVPAGVLGSSPILATPAFADRYDAYAAATTVHVELRDGRSDLRSFRAAVEEIGRALPPGAGVEEFPPVDVEDLGAGTAETRSSARFLVGALMAAVVVSTVAGSLGLGQALARHHAASAHDQAVEAALGLTGAERTLARVLPALSSALTAGILATAIALAGALVGPPGAVGRVEPDPGWLPQPAPVALGVAAVVLSVVGAAATTAWRAGPSSRSSLRRSGPRRPPAAWRHLVRGRSAWGLAGGAFALTSGSRGRPVPVRASLVGAVIGVAGLVAGLTVGASLDRLVDDPERWGWAGDLAVADANDDIVAELRNDDRIDAITHIASSTVQVEGGSTTAHTAEHVLGDIGWTLLSGRAPVRADEVTLGTREADRLDAEVGDTVAFGGGRARVVGIGLGPPLAGERLGASVLVTPEAMAATAEHQVFREAMVRAAPGIDPEDLARDLGARYELEVRSLPDEVRDLAELGAVPELLGGFLAALGAVALAHALAVTTRRRAVDLAVLRALGATAAEAARAVVAMALITAGVGVVIGAPLGWATGRLLWGEVARGAGVAGEIVVPATVAGALVAVVAVAALLAVMPAARAARVPPSHLLRTE
jgi:putative ABC transport system permease protein